MMLDKSDREYLELLRKHLRRAKNELENLRDRMDLKIIEIEQMEELTNTHGQARGVV